MTPYYEDASVRLYHGDCREILPTIGPVDHLISDPPYAKDVYVRASAVYTKAGSGTPKRMGLSESKRRGGALQKMANGDIGHMDLALTELVSAWIAVNVRRWSVVFSDVETCHQWKEALESAGVRYARTGCWAKPDAMPQMSGDRPAVGFEPCTIAHAKRPGGMKWNGGGKPALWIHNTAKGKGRPELHPCPKPEPLMRDLVLDFTDEGETVFDPFAGSGTTGVAAKRLGRKSILIEMDEEYAEIAAKRLAKTIYEPSLLPSPNIKGKQGSLLEQTA